LGADISGWKPSAPIEQPDLYKGFSDHAISGRCAALPLVQNVIFRCEVYYADNRSSMNTWTAAQTALHALLPDWSFRSPRPFSLTGGPQANCNIDEMSNAADDSPLSAGACRVTLVSATDSDHSDSQDGGQTQYRLNFTFIAPRTPQSGPRP
ncbi:MAG TPA: hypothetical protein VMD29_13265, partial [Terracidiphilus sp.]|nr:hypothetical protein [Terracidiphilus sp.]